ncbi:heparinase II/III domain-containing protein [Lacrimispora brassicae]
MKKQWGRAVGTLLLIAVVTISSTNTSFATNVTNQREAGTEAEESTERKILPASFGMPSTFPVKGAHPRVMFTKKDIPAIRANMLTSEGAYAMTELKRLLEMDVDGILGDTLLGTGSNLDYTTFSVIEAYAFDYAVNGNVENGRKAVEAARNVVKTFQYNPKKSDIVREKGVVIYLSALVYDWCYPLVSQEDKKLFVDNAETLAATITGMGGWPMTQVYAVHGHNSETHIQRDLLAFSIASYDEYPDIYNLVAGYIMNGLVETKNWWYRSGTYHQGLGYNALRFGIELQSQFMFYRMNGTKVYSDDMGKVPYMLLYNNRPDGRSFPEGDTNGDSLGTRIPTWVREDMPHLLYASSLWDDGYLKGEFKTYSKDFNFLSYISFHPLLTPVNFLIVNDPNVVPKSKTELPHTRLFDSPNGLMVARTGLNEGVKSSDAIAWAKIGETYVGNHAHLDSGSFQIYYKGPLAWDIGRYDSFGSLHDSNFAKETIGHNSLLIYDPDEKMTTATSIPAPRNSGGQRREAAEQKVLADLTDKKSQKAELLSMEYGEDPKEPEYSYISGDLAKGYSDKVSEVRRSMLFMPTGIEEKPAIFVVMDKITARKPTFKKTFLMYSLQEPKVDGNVTEIKRDTIGYNGKLTMQTLYPRNAQITKMGGPGRQNWVVDRNYPPIGGKYYTNFDSYSSTEFGWGRIEVSPSLPSETDYFLNVMYVSDADNLSPVDKADLIETEDILGARIFDKVSLFAKNKERLTKDISVTIPGEGQVAVTVAGISEGEWTITDAQGVSQKKTAKKEGGIIYFTGSAGTYHLQLNKY